MRRGELAKLRREVEDTIERLLAFLDRLDGDADLEPSLGASEFHSGHQLAWGLASASDDREPDGDELDTSAQSWPNGFPDWPPQMYVDAWAEGRHYAPLAVE